MEHLLNAHFGINHWMVNLLTEMILILFLSIDGYGDWSSKGCHNVNITNNKTEVFCECNHLTNFAILLVISSLIIITFILIDLRMCLLQ